MIWYVESAAIVLLAVILGAAVGSLFGSSLVGVIAAVLALGYAVARDRWA